MKAIAVWFISAMMMLTSRILKAVKMLPPVQIFLRAMSTSATPDLHSIREQFSKFEGGSVDLEMDEESGIAIVTLNNPRRLNSMTGKMMVDLAKHVDELERWKTGKGVILMGTQGAFCSGGDLTFVKKAVDGDIKLGRMMATLQHDTLTRFLHLPLISVALLQGHALGGGAELCTACDFRVMSSSAKIGFVNLKMGLTTGFGALTRLTRLMGRHKALALLTSAQVLTAEEALSIGLVDHVFSYAFTQEQEVSECKAWLQKNYCKCDAGIIQDVKRAIMFTDSNLDPYVSLENEREVFSKYWGGPLQKAALAANIKHKT